MNSDIVIRCASVVLFCFSSAAMLRGQESAFPPSKPYRAQLEERGPVRDLGLRDAIATALKYNLELEVEGYNRDAAQAGVANTSSYYDPIASLSASLLSSNIPATNILQTGELGSQVTRSWSVAPSIRENLPGGGSATVTLTVNRTSTNSDYSLINPYFGSILGFTITQPLWRGFLRTDAERQLVVSRLSRDMDENQVRQKISGTVEQVIGAYWKLMMSIETYEAERQRREVSVLEYELARKASSQEQDAASQRSDVVTQEQYLTQDAVQIIQAGNALKRLLSASIMDPIWAAGLMASDRPELKEPGVSLEEAVKTAMDQRPELAQLRLQLKQSDAEVRFDRRETKPQVNLRLEAESTGNAGRINEILGDVIYPAPGGLGAASRQTIGFDHPSVAAGVDIRMPIRNTAAKSQLAAAMLGNRKLEAQLRATQEDILVDVRNAWETIGAQRKNVDATGISRGLAERRVTAETAKPQSESQNLEVRRAQRDLADARVRELQALVDYQLSIVSLERSMNTLLDAQQISLTTGK